LTVSRTWLQGGEPFKIVVRYVTSGAWGTAPQERPAAEPAGAAPKPTARQVHANMIVLPTQFGELKTLRLSF
jgi:hypothetical protein